MRLADVAVVMQWTAPLWLGHVILSNAPASAPRRQPAFCAAAFERVQRVIEDDYAGFPDKTGGAARQRYAMHTDSLRRRAEALAGRDSVAGCHQLLLAWVGFFRDGHLAVTADLDDAGPIASPSANEIRARFRATPTRTVLGSDTTPAPGEPLARRRWRGTWRTLDGAYRLALVPTTPRALDVVVLAADGIWWTPGQIKARLSIGEGGRVEGEFLLRDHSPRAVVATLRANVLQFFARDDSTVAPITLVRDAPRRAGDLSIEEILREQRPTLGVRRVSAHTLLIGVPSFRPDQADSVAGLLATHRDEITRTRNLIIDVRGNGGGLDHVYRPLLALVASGPIAMPGTSFRSTPGNIRTIERYVDSTDMSEGTRGYLRTLLDSLRRHPGEFVTTGSTVDSSMRPTPRPLQVAILTDRGCASSCEQFVLEARQSTRVRVYGDRTAGILDYSNVVPRRVEGTPFTVHVPLSRSNRLPMTPVDPLGIAPDVRVPRDALRPVTWTRDRLEGSARRPPS